MTRRRRHVVSAVCGRAIVAAVLCCISVSGLQADPLDKSLTIVGFNVESEDASDLVVGLQLKQSRGIDIWALGEIWPDGGWVERMHEAAVEAEGADYGMLVGETGGADRLMMLFRSDRLDMLGHEELLAVGSSKRDTAPLVARMRWDGAAEFLVVLVRLSDTDGQRRRQTAALADWAGRQSLPVVAIGTFSFGLAEGRGPDAQMQQFLDTSGWRWLRPTADRDTNCEGGGRVDDFVLIGGGATDWDGRSEVMFPQSNYCPDSDRTSSHRPILARFSTGGGALNTEAGMTERQILPILPGDIQTGGDEDADQDTEIDVLRRRIEELEAGERDQPAPAAAGPDAPPPVPRRTIMSTGANGSDEPTPASEVTPAPSDADAVHQEALRRRLEALEQEVRELRKLLEDAPN